jgi:putative acetyltransferase
MTERGYQAADLPQIMTIYHDAIHILAAPFYSKDQLGAWAPQDQELDRWEQRLAHVRTVVIEDEGMIAGFASYDLAGHLDLLFVHPRCARRGVATRLCAAVERELRAAGVSRIFTEGSLAARAFFEQIGFRVTAEESVACRGVYLCRYAMEKQIPSLPFAAGTPSARMSAANPPVAPRVGAAVPRRALSLRVGDMPISARAGGGCRPCQPHRA